MADSTNFDDALELFEEQVRDNIKLLSSKDPKARLKAAAWLGEAGDPTAITMLMRVYKDDPEPKVRDTAKYSLGMFRKLEEELKKPDQSRVQKLLEDVAVHGKTGRRVPVPVRSLVKLELGMVISAILVAVLAFVVPSMFRQGAPAATQQSEQSATAIPTIVVPTAPAIANKDRLTVVNELQATLTLVTSNATKLQTQYQSMTTGGSLDCKQTFDTLIPVALSENNNKDFADLSAIATEINNLEAGFRSVKATFDRVCSGGEKLGGSDFDAPTRDLLALIQSITSTQANLTTAAAKPA